MKLIFRLIILCPLLTIITFSCKRKAVIEYKNEQMLLDKGQRISKNILSVLSQKLNENIAAGGIPQALEYCNLNALSITDSLSKAENVTGSRLSLKTRNIKNKAIGADSLVISDYIDQMTKGINLKPKIEMSNENEAKYYAPIYISEFCLQCHGKTGTDITPENIAIIKEKYPADMATGYMNGDLRGVWAISIRQEK